MTTKKPKAPAIAEKKSLKSPKSEAAQGPTLAASALALVARPVHPTR